MASDYTEDKSKRKSMRKGGRKLLVGEKVEVRSFEEGSKGSWHCGTVISCRKATRVVKYDHLLSDEDTSKKFVDVVGVSDYVDGIVSSHTSLSLSDYRGWIRPVPPQFTFDAWLLHYGQCVDMFYMDAWWEGVIFDHQDGSSARSIFFPDIGDEMEAHKDDLRITHDWDECGQKWKPRGNWLFLELIEEIEKDWPLVVSVKQIWYDVRVKKGFNNLKEWTSSLADIWRKLLLEVIVDNLRLTVKEFFDKLEELSGEDFQLLKLDEPTLDAILNNEAFFDDSLPMIVTGTTRLTQLVHGDIKEVVNQPFDDINMDKSVAALRLDTNAPVCSSHELTHEDPICMVASCPAELCKGDLGDFSTDHEESLDNEHVWTPNPDFVHKAEYCPEYCPDSIEQYCTLVRESKGKSNRGSEVKLSEVRLSVWKHLLFIGWTIEFRRSKSLNRMRRSRYTEPGSSGTCFHSLNKACKYLLGSGFGSNILSLCTDLKPKEMVPDNWDRAKLPEVELCEDAIIEYYNVSKHPPLEQLSLNALKRLRFLGWKIEFIQYERCWKYTHPDGDKCFSWLFDVCEYLTKSACAIVALPPQDEHNSALRAITNLSPRSRLSQGCSDEFIKSYNSDELVEHSPPDNIIPEPEYCHQAIMNYYSRGLKEQGEKLKDMQLKAKKHLSAVGWKLYYYYRNNSRAFKELRYSSPSGKLYYSLRSACKGYLGELISMGKQTEVELIGEGQFSPLAIKEFHGKQGEEEVIYGTSCVQHHVFELSNPLRKEGNPKEIQVTNLRDNLHGTSGCVLRSSKRIREAPFSSNSSPRTILSWLIDNDMVLPRAKVHCRRKKDNQKIAEGRVTRDGIKCNCCQGVFTLSKFETHAKSAYHQPTANIYLEDGRSLLDCQMQLRRDVNTSGSTTRPYEVKRKIQKENDHICSMCHLGGDLILCDRCPSSFHTSCLGLKEVPNGDWFCPPCCCKICGKSETNMDLDVFISCAQCKFRYHIDCLRKKGLVLEGCPNGYWFCTTRCEQISSSLEKILGKPIEIGIDNITWTLLKYTKPDSCNADSSVVLDSTEKYSKLNIALGVMHECFEPISERQTTDLVEDVIFNRWSELNRLNFRGFYTVLLEKNDELISAASVRICGEKVAEIPLVATRFAYQRHGMCRILMNHLEEVLVELGVQRLVLPAIPSVLNTWISSFGFSRMSKSQRLKFLDYSFLSFERTIMCQKLLLKTPCRDSLPPRIRKRHSGVTNGSDNINSTDLRGNKSRSRNDKDSLALAVRQPTGSEYIVGQPEINPERSVEGSDSAKEDEGSGPIICYKRRRISKSGEA